MTPIQLFIADDHRMFAEGLESVLSQSEELNVLGIAHSGIHLIALMQTKLPDIVLLDISMPELDGHRTAELILQKFPAVKILMLTMHHSEDHIMPLVKLGVHGYILKNSGKAEVLRAIRTVINTGNYFSPEISAKIAAYKRSAPAPVKISHREKEILQLVFEGLSTNMISEKLFISPRTVETHRKNLLSKTGASNTAQLIHFALEHNLLSKHPGL
jgi:two-component system response regulator DegU